MKKYTINFEAGEGRSIPGGVNFMACLELPDLYAEIAVPDDASDDYGYIALKTRILAQAQALDIAPEDLSFWHDGQENKLAPDAWAGVKTWWIVDDNGDQYEENTRTTDKDAALREAFRQWGILTPAEKTHRKAFYIALAKADERGLMDMETGADDVVDVKGHGPREISLDNGRRYMDAAEAIAELQERAEESGAPFEKLWEAVASLMDDDTREQVHAELAPCTAEEFLTRYLELAPCDLVIG